MFTLTFQTIIYNHAKNLNALQLLSKMIKNKVPDCNIGIGVWRLALTDGDLFEWYL